MFREQSRHRRRPYHALLIKIKEDQRSWLRKKTRREAIAEEEECAQGGFAGLDGSGERTNFVAPGTFGGELRPKKNDTDLSLMGLAHET